MMLFKHLLIASLLVGLGLTGTAQAAKYSLSAGSGAQIMIGGGLPLPIQPVVAGWTGMNAPPLLINVVKKDIRGTRGRTTGQKLMIPAKALTRPVVPSFPSVGQFANNPNIYGVQTKLDFTWPAVPVTFQVGTAGRTGNTTTTFVAMAGNNIRYSNVLGRKFGGPGIFHLSWSGQTHPSTAIPGAPVTVWAIAVPPAGNPACAHPAFGGANAACVAAAVPAYVVSNIVIGGPVGLFGTTPGTPNAVPGIFVVSANAAGTILQHAPGGASPGPTNMASSFGYPHTTGMITLSAPLAAGAPEVWVISGYDNRDAKGEGMIQLVSGSLSLRSLTGPNANRGWVRLNLVLLDDVPALSPAGLAGIAGLMLLAGGYAMRRRLFAAA